MIHKSSENIGRCETAAGGFVRMRSNHTLRITPSIWGLDKLRYIKMLATIIAELDKTQPEYA